MSEQRSATATTTNIIVTNGCCCRSRWEKYSFGDLQQIASIYEEQNLPLDGINLDTEWHVNSDYLDGGTGNYGGGFDWDRSLYPSPTEMIGWFDERGLWPVWFDIHQSHGVLPTKQNCTNP